MYFWSGIHQGILQLDKILYYFKNGCLIVKKKIFCNCYYFHVGLFYLVLSTSWQMAMADGYSVHTSAEKIKKNKKVRIKKQKTKLLIAFSI